MSSPSSNGRSNRQPAGQKKSVAKKTGRTASRTANTYGKTNGKRRPLIAEVVRRLPAGDLTEAWRFWSGESTGTGPSTSRKTRAEIIRWMTEPERVMERLDSLGKRLSPIFDLLLATPRFECAMSDLAGSKEIAYLTSYDLEASLGILQRRGLVHEGNSRRVKDAGARAYMVAPDLGDTILHARRARRRGIFDTFTLRGYLDGLYDDPALAGRTSPSRVREMYKMYSNGAASVARVERLPEGLRSLMQTAVLEFGGILPRGLFDRMETDLPHWNGRRWGKILKESLIGTVEQLDLTRYGIQHSGETLIVFNEVTLAWLKRVAVPSDPDAPHDEASLGVDLVSNLSRFLAFIIDHNVRFTVRGEIFKTTEKRILSDLIPNPGRELEREEVLEFIYRFARHSGLIESTGERTFTLTAEGRDWEEQELDEKLRILFEYVLEEPGLGGDYYHQVRMRHIFLRMVKRIEPGVWYDIMYLPFLARNNYLCRLDELAIEEYFAALSTGGQVAASDDLQRLAWSLVGWVRKRLYLLGLVDLGYDRSGHPVAMRLTRIGARLLGMVDPEPEAPRVGNLVVTPDFEVVLFPTGDDGELTHDLDRFCERERQGGVKHFRISDRSVKRALMEGMNLQRMFDTLALNARTPVPQNVLHSMRDWAVQAGLLVLSSELLVRSSDPDTLRRFVQDPGVKSYIKRVRGEGQVQLKGGTSATRMRSLLRELGFLVELE